MPDATTPANLNPQEDVWGIPPASISWDVEPPFTVEGAVLSWEVAQQTNIETRKPMVWDDGRPRKKVIITLQTKAGDDPTDDGKRAMHVPIPSALFASIRSALQEAGYKSMPVGGKVDLATTYTHQEAPERKGLSGQKQFQSLISEASDSNTSEPPL